MPFERMFNNFPGHEILIFLVKISYYYQDYIQPLNQIPIIIYTFTGSTSRMIFQNLHFHSMDIYLLKESNSFTSLGLLTWSLKNQLDLEPPSLSAQLLRFPFSTLIDTSLYNLFKWKIENKFVLINLKTFLPRHLVVTLMRKEIISS